MVLAKGQMELVNSILLYFYTFILLIFNFIHSLNCICMFPQVTWIALTGEYSIKKEHNKYRRLLSSISPVHNKLPKRHMPLNNSGYFPRCCQAAGVSRHRDVGDPPASPASPPACARCNVRIVHCRRLNHASVVFLRLSLTLRMRKCHLSRARTGLIVSKQSGFVVHVAAWCRRRHHHQHHTSAAPFLPVMYITNSVNTKPMPKTCVRACERACAEPHCARTWGTPRAHAHIYPANASPGLCARSPSTTLSININGRNIKKKHTFRLVSNSPNKNTRIICCRRTVLHARADRIGCGKQRSLVFRGNLRIHRMPSSSPSRIHTHTQWTANC